MPNEICIENLCKNVDVSALSFLFKKHGRILSCRIDVDKHFASIGRGHISFDNPSSAYHAVKTMDGSTFQGNKIKVSSETSDTNANIKGLREHFTKIYVKNIHPQWDDCDLISEFNKFGEISEAQVSMNEDGKSNGYGFVIFKKHSDAKAAVEEKHKIHVVQPFIPKTIRHEKPSSPESAREVLKKSIQFNNLHVKNIPKNIQEDELEKLFEKFGRVTSVKIARDDAQRSKGFGFVCFESESNAEKARLDMNGYSLNSNTLVVNFNQKKGARQQYLAFKNLESDVKSQAKLAEIGAGQSKKNILFSFSSK